MSDPEPINGRWRPAFRPEITLGHVLQFVGMVMIVVVWGLRLETRVNFNEERSVRNEKVLAIHAGLPMHPMGTAEFAGLKGEWGARLKAIEESLARLEKKIDSQGDR